jgi:hypothetical protein
LDSTALRGVLCVPGVRVVMGDRIRWGPRVRRGPISTTLPHGVDAVFVRRRQPERQSQGGMDGPREPGAGLGLEMLE